MKNMPHSHTIYRAFKLRKKEIASLILYSENSDELWRRVSSFFYTAFNHYLYSFSTFSSSENIISEFWVHFTVSLLWRFVISLPWTFMWQNENISWVQIQSVLLSHFKWKTERWKEIYLILSREFHVLNENFFFVNVQRTPNLTLSMHALLWSFS
jgi:hypothetical protein